MRACVGPSLNVRLLGVNGPLPGALTAAEPAVIVTSEPTIPPIVRLGRVTGVSPVDARAEAAPKAHPAVPESMPKCPQRSTTRNDRMAHRASGGGFGPIRLLAHMTASPCTALLSPTGRFASDSVS